MISTTVFIMFIFSNLLPRLFLPWNTDKYLLRFKREKRISLNTLKQLFLSGHAQKKQICGHKLYIILSTQTRNEMFSSSV